ncbi:unnamed protein product [Cuscuta campestris]|uniref:glutathione transferase n=1 Tax=Cuscuta campestris TaxID=132261 RepID=A0A484NFW9_9ASTE|nr:unnamed protein product [Cuscuta campestris]
MKNNKAAWKKNKDNTYNLLVAVFHGSRAPSLTVHQYLDRIFRYSDCSPACFVVAYIYLDRFVARTGAVLTSLNVHRLLITSVMLAAKFLDDRCYNNGYYARVGGISNSELNKLELKLLTALHFQLHVTLPTFNAYCLHLIRETQSPVNQPRRRRPPVKLFGFRKYIGFEAMDEVKLLGCWVSPFAHRVKWALELRGVKYEYIEEDLSNKSQLLLESNPVHKKVPVLLHGDRAISESAVILEYIDEGSAYHSFIVSNEESREKSKEELTQVLKILEDEALKDKKFFGGDEIGVVDIIFGNIPHWFEAMEEVVGVKVVEPNTLPRLHAWAQRFKQVPKINHSLPPYHDLLLFVKGFRQSLISNTLKASAQSL